MIALMLALATAQAPANEISWSCQQKEGTSAFNLVVVTNKDNRAVRIENAVGLGELPSMWGESTFDRLMAPPGATPDEMRKLYAIETPPINFKGRSFYIISWWSLIYKKDGDQYRMMKSEVTGVVRMGEKSVDFVCEDDV